MIQSSGPKESVGSENEIVKTTNVSDNTTTTPSTNLPKVETNRTRESQKQDTSGNILHSTKDASSSLSVKTTPDVQDTSYRIQPTTTTTTTTGDVSLNASVSKNTNTNKSISTKLPTGGTNIDSKKDTDASVTTTLHFASGLTLPISSSTLSNKKMIANAGRIANSGTKSTNLRPLPQSAIVYKGDSGDVHEKLRFSALRDSSRNEVTHVDEAKKKKMAQDKILESKKSAARAMLGIHSTLKGNDYRLLKHLRFQLDSVSNVEKCTTNTHEGASISITFDPDYEFMTHDMGLQFLKDVNAVIQEELSKMKDTTSSSSDYKTRFLQDHLTQPKDDSAQPIDLIPQWLQPFMKTKDSEVSLLLTVLSRIENVVLQSYDVMNGVNPSSSQSPLLLNVGESDAQQKMLTPPTTPLVKSSRISLDGSVECFHTPREFDSLEGNGSQKVTPDSKQHFITHDILAILSKSTNEKSSYLRNLFKTQEAMTEHSNKKENFEMQSLLSTELKINDLLLVPTRAQCCEKNSSSTEQFKSTIEIWNTIISSAAKLVNIPACMDESNNLEFSGDGQVFELFADDGFDANATKKKKKKKKNKKKKKQKSSTTENAADDHDASNSFLPTSSTELKDANEDFSIPNECATDTVVPVVSTKIVEDCKTNSKVDIENSKPTPLTSLESKTSNSLNDNVSVVAESEAKEDLHDNDGWETVEHKATTRSKRASANAKLSEKNLQNQPNNATGNASSGRKRKGNRRRNRNKEKDSGRPSQEVVDSDALKRTTASTNKGAGDSKKSESMQALAPAVSKGSQISNGSGPNQQNRPLKDVLMSNLPKEDTMNINGPMKLADAVRTNMIKSSRTAVTDQTTASTGPDTISAASKSRPVVDESARTFSRTAQVPLKKMNEQRFESAMTETKENSCGSSSTDETSTRRTILMTKNSVLPFSTLVGPSNMNSADSSVASSLEAPHATRHGVHHHHQKSPKEDDVGYHLLKVCEKLSSDMDIFMSRRALALNVRRRERRDLLASLQDTVQNIWPSRCKVEMYGSCATRLDLPSSDLDVVVCGLDRMDPSTVLTEKNSESGSSHSFSPRNESPNTSYHHQYYIPLSVNGHRVLRLAAELEKVPWAVQVKPIPTASVPVIKILADPSRLPGSRQMDWMLHQQHLAVAAAEMNCPKIVSHQQESTPEVRNSEGQPGGCASTGVLSGVPPNTTSYQNTWRGADVMNGLLSLDITFEGPEHGGLGSTAFSARVVQEACNETGLPPESTPAVKVLMVIKEMLAQRRLNEPFSGGLSSYAILLLVVAVIKERRIIRREMDRVEQQQLAVTSQSVGAHSQSSGNKMKKGGKNTSENNSSVSPAPLLTKKTSWAAIAMKASDTTRKDNDIDVKPKVQDSNSPKSSDLDTSSAMNARDDDVDESIHDTTLFPQGSNDVLEVLCSGEPTAGKLLMHFLLFYGRHFDATTTCIDVSGTHHPDYKKARNKLQTISHLSPYVNRKPGGTYNPTTDVYTVDPIIIYDPLEGSESNNVSRTCYAWENIRWTFEQCYNTLSGVVELGAGSRNDRNRSKSWPAQGNGQSADPDDLSVQPLLELLLSF